MRLVKILNQKKFGAAPAHRYEKSSGQNWATNRYVPRL